MIEDQINKPGNKQPPEDRPAFMIGLITLEAFIQMLIMFWMKWISRSLFNFEFNGLLCWIALMIIFVTLGWYYETANKIFIYLMSLLCVLTVAAFII